MAFRFLSLTLTGFLILLAVGASESPVPSENINFSASKAISDLKDAIVKGLGFQGQDLKISGFDQRDALVGQSVAYEFDVEIGDMILPFKFVEDVKRWESVDFQLFQLEGEKELGKSLAERSSFEGSALPVLAPFQLAGPMEIWIQDGDDMRLSLPHDVDAGVLKKVVLADGAVVTVKGAKSVILRHPLNLPLPLNLSTQTSPLLTLAHHLRLSSLSNNQLVSLRIVGPTSLTTTPLPSSSKPKVKRLAPGLIELSKSKPTLEEQFTTLWPLASVNGSNANLRGFSELLTSILGVKAHEEGSFRLRKADVSAQTFMKIGFKVEKELKEGEVDWSGFPDWRTRPEKSVMQFEVIGKFVDGKVILERVEEVSPEIVNTVASNVLEGNMTMSRMPIIHPPPSFFTL
ncbi:protein TUNICAMYCIN INDUCED 1-like [Tasmannia lanceolata]|uniref:protein TUNICAMYCIN INDUCED 1-like n=1 Tax=Tasmannia lanceolata TaxID=3420 RepID=UPI0040647220